MCFSNLRQLTFSVQSKQKQIRVFTQVQSEKNERKWYYQALLAVGTCPQA